MYPTTHCFGCNSYLVKSASVHYKCCNKDCKINYDINAVTNYITFDINAGNEKYYIALNYIQNKTFIDRPSFPSAKYFYIADQVLDMSLQEWQKFIERLDKLQILQ